MRAEKEKYWRNIVKPYTLKSNFTASIQLTNTLMPLIIVWCTYLFLVKSYAWVLWPCSIIATPLIARCFVLLHDCGHGSLFNSIKLNKIFGAILGIITGMPQYVWSKRHAYHHRTNGDWTRYNGPLATISTHKFNKLPPIKQYLYKVLRKPIFFPIAGFLYITFNPRFNWIKDTILLATFIASNYRKSTFLKLCENFSSPSWRTLKEYKHQCINNLILLCFAIMLFLYSSLIPGILLYSLSTSLSAAVCWLFFSAQHNFEGSYAADTPDWDYYKGALEGSSFFILHPALNWITADIAYHHIHHLSTSIPNYNLKKCHEDNQELFQSVKRLRLGDLLQSIKYILWDMDNETLVSIDNYNLKFIDCIKKSLRQRKSYQATSD